MARAFNGTSDQITYPHVSAFDGISNLTISAWVYSLTATDWYAPLIEQGNAAGTSGFRLQHFETDATKRIFAYAAGEADGANTLTATGLVTLNQWNHFYVVYDGSDFGVDRVGFWLNGTPVSMNLYLQISATLGTTTGLLRLGNGVGLDASEFWPGRLAEVGLWLDSDETRLTDLAAGKAPSFFQTNLHVYLPLISGDGAVDVQGNAGSPTITGTTEVAHPAGITYPSSGPPRGGLGLMGAGR